MIPPARRLSTSLANLCKPLLILATFPLTGSVLAQPMGGATAPATTFDFAAPFIWKEDQPDTAMKPVIQASPSDEEPAPAFLYGPAPQAGTPPNLTARLEETRDFPQQWKLEVTGAAGSLLPDLTTWQLQTDKTGTGEATLWYWRGGISLKWIGTEVQAAASAGMPRIIFALEGGKTTKLIPSEVWFLAGGSHLSEIQKAPPDKGSQIWQAVSRGGSTVWEPAATPGRVATAFVRERRSLATYKNFPVTMISIVSPRAFLADWLSPANPQSLTAALRSTPFEASPANNLLPFGCRGLVWWHGEWEADCHSEVNEDALAAGGQKAVDAFRARYAGDLKKFLKAWWERYRNAPTFQEPAKSGETDAQKSERDKRNAQLIENSGNHVNEIEIRVVQLPSVGHKTANDEGFRTMTTGPFPHPVSTWTAIRQAQYDVVSALQGDSPKIPAIRLYPLLPTATGAPGYQPPAVLAVPPVAPVVPEKAWMTSFGARGVGSQLEEVGAALAGKRAEPVGITLNDKRIKITGLQNREPNSDFNFASLFVGLPSHEPPVSVQFTDQGLLIDFKKTDVQFRTKAADEVFTIRTKTGELVPAFSYPLSP